MSILRFLMWYLITIGVTLAALFLFGTNADNGGHLGISYYAIPAFSVLSFVVFFFTKVADAKKHKQLLLNLVILNVLFKFLISAVVIMWYYKTVKPEDGNFVLPFIIIYVIFTVFETYFMSIQAKER